MISFINSRKSQLLFLQILFSATFSIFFFFFWDIILFFVPSKSLTFPPYFFITLSFSALHCLVSPNLSSSLLILCSIMSTQMRNPIESFFQSYYFLDFFICFFFNVPYHFLWWTVPSWNNWDWSFIFYWIKYACILPLIYGYLWICFYLLLLLLIFPHGVRFLCASFWLYHIVC